MDLLVVESLDAEVLRWLEVRHHVVFAPELERDRPHFVQALGLARAAIIPPSCAVDAELLKRAPRLRLVARLSVGAENIDIQACKRLGVDVVRPATASAMAEAEFVVGALLALLRRVPVVGSDGLMLGRELGACTVGLVGMTAAVQPLAKILHAFGARVLGYDPSLHADDPQWASHGVRAVALRDLMGASDGVAVLLSAFSRYKGLFGERLLQSAKAQQVLVSLAHSDLFDEAALAQALIDGPLAAAWMDSLDPGALDTERPLSRAGTLQATPRVGSLTQSSRLRGAWAVAKRVDELLRTPDFDARSAAISPAKPDASAGPANGSGSA